MLPRFTWGSWLLMRTIWVWSVRVVGVLTSVALVSCTGVRTTYLSSGVKGYSISCRGFVNTWDSCLVKAGQLCGPQGYDTVHGDRYDRMLLIGCKQAGTATAAK